MGAQCCAVSHVVCSLYPILHPAPCTLHPASSTLHPAPCTPRTQHPALCTPHLRRNPYAMIPTDLHLEHNTPTTNTLRVPYRNMRDEDAVEFHNNGTHIGVASTLLPAAGCLSSLADERAA